MAELRIEPIPCAGRTHYQVRLYYGAQDRYVVDLKYCHSRKQALEFLARLKSAPVYDPGRR